MVDQEDTFSMQINRIYYVFMNTYYKFVCSVCHLYISVVHILLRFVYGIVYYTFCLIMIQYTCKDMCSWYLQN